MNRISAVAAGVAAVAMLCSQPALAAPMSKAEKLRRLDIMLMVTGLRCRTTADNFQADYGRFTTRHITELSRASDALKGELAARYGAGGASRALDRLSVTMANAYGQGHPWLNCAQLKQVARGLANVTGPEPLLAAADQLLASSGTPQFAWSR